MRVGSPVTSCAGCASSPRRSTRSKRDRRARRPSRPQLLNEPGFGPLTAAKLVGEIAGAARFSSDAKLARAAGLAPIPVSSGRTDRHRLDRGGNRQINATIHRVAVTRARCHPETSSSSPAKRPKERPTAKPSAPSNATSRAASGSCCARPTPCRKLLPTHGLLDKGAAGATVGGCHRRLPREAALKPARVATAPFIDAWAARRRRTAGSAVRVGSAAMLRPGAAARGYARGVGGGWVDEGRSVRRLSRRAAATEASPDAA